MSRSFYFVESTDRIVRKSELWFERTCKIVGRALKNMDTFGIYGHEMQGDTDLTAQMIQDRFTDLLSNSKNKVNFENSQKENLNKSHD